MWSYCLGSSASGNSYVSLILGSEMCFWAELFLASRVHASLVMLLSFVCPAPSACSLLGGAGGSGSGGAGAAGSAGGAGGAGGAGRA